MIKISSKKNGPNVIIYDKKVKIKVKKDGNYEEMETNVVALCRCGQSKNKPFCDGSHRTVNFQADEAEIELPE